MKRTLFSTALLVSALAGGPAQAKDAPREQVEIDIQVARDGQAEPIRLQAQRIVIQAPDQVDREGQPGQIVIVREIRIDENGNAVVLDENGNVIEHGPEGVWIEGEAVPADWIAGGEAQPLPVEAQMVEATYLGVQAEPLDFESADLLLVPRGTGLNVLGVPADSPAAAAELQAGDVLLKFNDQVLINPAQLAVLIRTRDAGEKVTLTVLRNGEELELEAELATATVPALGPGGEPTNRGWQVQPMPAPRNFNPRPGQIEPLPIEGIDLQEHLTEIERMIQQQQEQLLRMIEQIEGGDVDLRQQQERIRQQLRERIREQQQLPRADNAQRAMNFGDGQHSIAIKGDGDGWQTLKVTDNAGGVIYDGDYPQTDEQWQQVPDPVRAKVRNMVENNPIELRFHEIERNIRPAAPQPERDDLPQPEPLPQA